MKESMTRSYCLAKELSQLFDLEGKIDTMLSVSMYYLNQLMDSERSSIWLFQHWNQQLTIFSSLDLEKNEIRIPKSCGVAGWVFVNRKPAIVNDAYEDSRFYSKVDDMTRFHTRNLVCTPLIDCKDHCLGTLQSLNKKTGDFTTDDLELLDLAARMVAVAINNSRRYKEILVTNEARRNFIKKISGNIGNIFD
ncbi:MAG: GAF domain-containing protein [Desulfobacterales bacterium]|jgi:GAF domain-containing protein